MTVERITTVDEFRKHMGSGGDRGNMFVATSTSAFGPDEYEKTSVDQAVSFQVEGVIIHPRHLEVRTVEIVTEDADECRYLLHCIRTSQTPLAEVQAEGVMLARCQSAPYRGLDDDYKPPLSDLGDMVKDEDEVEV